MKIRLLFFLLPMLWSMAAVSQNITGTNPALIGNSYTYTFSDGALHMNYGWQLSGTGTIVTSWVSGTSYNVTMNWTAGGSTTLYFVDYTVGVIGTLVVTINPATPNATFTNVRNCSSTDITRATNPPSGVNWYWQTSSTGTSTSLGLAATINRTTTSTLYLRARWGTTGAWSASSQQVPAFTIIATPPSVPNGSTDGNAISNAAVNVPILVSPVSGANNYKWYTASLGGTAIAGQTGNSWSPLLSATQQYWVEAAIDNCSSTSRRAVTAYVHPEPIIAATNSGAIAFGNPVVLSIANYSYDTFQWLDASNNDSPISGAASSSYTTSTEGKYKVKVSKASSPLFTSQAFTVSSAYSQNVNYIISNTILTTGVTSETTIKTLPVESVGQNIQYFDGLGRPTQSVSTQGSPNKKDIVQSSAYDAFNREAVKYLPYAAVGTGSDNGGLFKSSASPDQLSFYTNTSAVASDAAPFAKTIFEPSPLNRVIKQGAPGTSWQPDGTNAYSSTDHTVKKAYDLNTDNEVIRWTYVPPDASHPNGIISPGQFSSLVYYAANKLYKTKTKDEEGHEVIEYVDMQGKTVLKKVQAPNSEWALTYYVYDDKELLVAVLQPEAVKVLLGY